MKVTWLISLSLLIMYVPVMGSRAGCGLSKNQFKENMQNAFPGDVPAEQQLGVEGGWSAEEWDSAIVVLKLLGRRVEATSPVWDLWRRKTISVEGEKDSAGGNSHFSDDNYLMHSANGRNARVRIEPNGDIVGEKGEMYVGSIKNDGCEITIARGEHYDSQLRKLVWHSY